MRFPGLPHPQQLSGSVQWAGGGGELRGGRPPLCPRSLPSYTVEALKTLMWSSGYGDLVSHMQTLEGWELLTSPERHYEGVAVLGR